MFFKAVPGGGVPPVFPAPHVQCVASPLAGVRERGAAANGLQDPLFLPGELLCLFWRIIFVGFFLFNLSVWGYLI